MDFEACPVCGVAMSFFICATCDGVGDFWNEHDDLAPCEQCRGEGGHFECRELHTFDQIVDHYLAGVSGS